MSADKPLLTPDADIPHVSPRTRLRNYFLTGLVVAGPLAVTTYITLWFIELIDGWVKPLIPNAYLPDAYLNVKIPGVGLILAIVGLTLLGFLTANLVGRYIVGWSEMLLERMPVVSGLYSSVKQIFETVFSQSGTSFRKVGLVQFPQPGMWTLVFISTAPSGAVASAIPGEADMISVFLPCTPNPTTGFYFYLPRSEVIEVAIPVDEAAKLIMSAGLIQPGEQQRKLQLLANQASKAA
jgi:uncharacterized membrane protein